MNPLVQFEYVAKAAKGAGVNYRWAILPDGRYLLGQNPAGIVRPGADPWWFAGPMVEVRQLSPADLEAVNACVARLPFGAGRIAPPRPTPDGDLSRLTVRTAAAAVVREVEDRCDDAHEAWLAGLVRLLLPAAAAVIDTRYR